MKIKVRYTFFLICFLLVKSNILLSQDEINHHFQHTFSKEVRQNIFLIKDARKRDFQIHKIEAKNLIKFTVSDVLLGGLGLSYEREILPHVGLQVQLRYCYNYQIPVVLLIDNFLNGAASKQLDVIDFYNTLLKNYSITIEPRFYSGGRKNIHFYWGPFVRYENLDVNVPFNLVNNNTIPVIKKKLSVDGKINGYYAGINIGVIKNLSARWVFEFDIFGIGYGQADYIINFNSNNIPLTPQDQQDLNNSIVDFQNFTTQNKFNLQNFKYSVQEEFANISFSGPYLGFRGIGATICYRF